MFLILWQLQAVYKNTPHASANDWIFLMKKKIESKKKKSILEQFYAMKRWHLNMSAAPVITFIIYKDTAFLSIVTGQLST